MWRKRTLLLCALLSVFALSAWSQDAAEFEAVRPSGVSHPIRKAKAVTARDTDPDDADAESKSARETKSSKSSHASSHRKRAKAKQDTQDTIPAPTQFTPEGIPKTTAASVIVVDANSGKILYKKTRTKHDPQRARKNY